MENKILDYINNCNSIVLITHVNPDGDAIGSVFSLYYWLLDINKSVDIVMPEVPEIFKYFKDIDKVVDKSDKIYDLAIAVDCSSESRMGIGDCEKINYKYLINIDHHVSNNNFGDLNFVKGNEPACSQIIYYLFKKMNINISVDMATAIMSGVLTDTAGFRNDDVNKDTFLLAADLSNVINISKLYDKLVSKKNMAQFKLSRLVMDRIELFNDGKIAFASIDDIDLKDANAVLGDHEGLVDIGRNLVGVEVSIFVRKDKDDYLISLRSNGKVNVGNIASKFNGGGHKMAAGGKVQGDLNDIKEKLIKETLKELNN